MEITHLLRECRADHRYDAEPRWSNVQFDADSSNGVLFVPDFDEDDYTSSLSSYEDDDGDLESEDENEDEDNGSAGEDDGSNESYDATGDYDAKLADLALERNEWLKLEDEDPTPPTLPGRRFVEVIPAETTTDQTS